MQVDNFVENDNKEKAGNDKILWDKWNTTKSPEDLQRLVHKLEPIIYNTTTKLSGGSISADTLKSKGVVLAVKAIKTYDPNKGVTLATHVTNNLAPLHRVVYTHQNTARLPENITLKINQYNAAKDYLLSTNGREPSIEELHQELGWSTNEIKKLDLYQRKDLVESLNNTGDAFGKDDKDGDLLAALYYDLNPTERKLFAYTTGYNSPKMSNPQMMKALGLNQAQLSYQKTLLTKKIKKLIDQSGYINRDVNSVNRIVSVE